MEKSGQLNQDADGKLPLPIFILGIGVLANMQIRRKLLLPNIRILSNVFQPQNGIFLI